MVSLVKGYKEGEIVKGWAETLYDAYCVSLPIGDSSPPWEELPPKIKDAWTHTALTFADEVKRWESGNYTRRDDGTVRVDG